MRAPALAVLLVAASPVFADPPPYLDDRSDATALLRSYYNAINRKEYARAWGYFGDDKPARDFDAFARGYADTDSVELRTGTASEEGAAGSVYFQLPVAIRATGADGADKVFAGCYVARLADPGVQADDFHPMHIVSGVLKASEEPFPSAVPATCGDGPAPEPRDMAFARARALFSSAHGEECMGGFGGDDEDPQAHTIRYRSRYDTDDAAMREAQLFRFFCGRGAYNESHVYYLHDEVDGLRELHFAEPELAIRYQEPDSDEKVESMRIIGFTTSHRLVNSFYDEETLTITSHSKWRGIGDASSIGRWLFRDGAFTLVQYDVDASYDGEIDHETVLDYNTAP